MTKRSLTRIKTSFFPRQTAEVMASCLMAADTVGKPGKMPVLDQVDDPIPALRRQ